VLGDVAVAAEYLLRGYRAGEAAIDTALQVAATVVWRVTQEPLEPGGNEP